MNRPATSSGVVVPPPRTVAGARLWTPSAPATALLLLALGIPDPGGVRAQAPGATPYPILFVTQIPIPADFTTIGSTFGNHLPTLQAAGRGGDLWIRYTDGTLRNLTAAAGFGSAGFQGAQSIAVRDPSVHWSGAKGLFSMVIGAPQQQYVWETYRWQIYEITGLGPNDAPVVVRVPNQPDDANNVSPFYGTDDRVLFTSDRPFNGASHLHPQRDEYEAAPIVTGIWSLDPVSGDLVLLTHAPSGDFTPFIDSFGRIVFTRWDHLQRDQLADADALGAGSYGTFNWSDESQAALPLNDRTEVFPEPRSVRTDLLAGTNMVGHAFNHFFPWQVNEDGTGIETLNHVGRHELHSWFDRAITGDPNIVAYTYPSPGAANTYRIVNLFQMKESPAAPGLYYGVDAPEFTTHAAGQIVTILGPPGLNGDQMTVTPITHPDTRTTTATPGPGHTGHYREPLPLSDGTLVAVHAPETDVDANTGTTANPASRYAFRLRRIAAAGNWFAAGPALTPGISKTVSYWNPDVLVTWSGVLWELNPVEVRPRVRPWAAAAPLEAPELAAFAAAGVEPESLRAWLAAQNLALVVSRNVTTRDDADRQQPFNLRRAGTSAQTVTVPGAVYDVSHLQFMQADLIRGFGGTSTPAPGRRVLARPMHDPAAANPPSPGAPGGSVALGPDASLAAFVPARRAMSWQLLGPVGDPIVRERYWVSFQPGEVRVCASCHGANEAVHGGQSPPANTPQALVSLLQWWQTQPAPAPSLGPEGAGTVGIGQGGPFDVLAIDGSFGGASRRVDVGLGQPFTLSVLQPPSAPTPSSFALWGFTGVPGPAAGIQTTFGAMTFRPLPLDPDAPWLFTLANNLWPDPAALVVSSPAPWSLPVPGLPFPLTLTFQGLIVDSPGPSSPLGITNGVILRVE